jgi:hypothetical protein
MNGTTAKQIRKLAATLPDVFIYKKVSKPVEGKKLLKTMKTFEGQKIIPGEVYHITTTIPEKVCYVDRIKKVFAGGGEVAVAKYVAHSKAIGAKQAQDKLNYKKPSRLERFIKIIKKMFCSWRTSTKA